MRKFYHTYFHGFYIFVTPELSSPLIIPEDNFRKVTEGQIYNTCSTWVNRANPQISANGLAEIVGFKAFLTKEIWKVHQDPDRMAQTQEDDDIPSGYTSIPEI